MPGRSSHLSIHTWPDRATVDAAVRGWASGVVATRTDVIAIGYVGSYARGDWGPGSDVDLIVILAGDLTPIGERARGWDTTRLPVPADLVLYSEREWRGHVARSGRWRETVHNEAVWVVGSPPEDAADGGGRMAQETPP